MINRVKFFGQE